MGGGVSGLVAASAKSPAAGPDEKAATTLLVQASSMEVSPSSLSRIRRCPAGVSTSVKLMRILSVTSV